MKLIDERKCDCAPFGSVLILVSRRKSVNFRNTLQLAVPKCMECGQALPESYAPPADEPWMTGICGCAEDRDSCKLMHDETVKICSNQIVI